MSAVRCMAVYLPGGGVGGLSETDGPWMDCERHETNRPYGVGGG